MGRATGTQRQSLELGFKNDFLNLYLEYVEETETPRLMHVWSLLTSVSACLNRKMWYKFGPFNMYPNLYVFLIGPPGVRKSSGMQILKKMMEKSTNVRFAPDDTGGQRQGMLIAMRGREEKPGDDEFEGLIDTTDVALMANKVIDISDESRHTMYVCQSELTAFLTASSAEMLPFLNKCYDGEDYKYGLKNSDEILSRPLLTMIGCTTTSQIVNVLPKEAIGQGFMSRVILVHADQKYKELHKPLEMSEVFGNEIERRLSHISNNMEGPFGEDADCDELLKQLYMRPVSINDNRFIYYGERRHSHLLKTAMCLAACRLSKQIAVQDINEADAILRATEAGMPEALGEYGMSPIALAKEKIVEFIKSTKTAVPMNVIWAVMHKDMRSIVDCTTAIGDLVNAKKLLKVQTNDGIKFIAVESNKDAKLKELLDDIAEPESLRQPGDGSAGGFQHKVAIFPPGQRQKV